MPRLLDVSNTVNAVAVVCKGQGYIEYEIKMLGLLYIGNNNKNNKYLCTMATTITKGEKREVKKSYCYLILFDVTWKGVLCEEASEN
jgi:hypothetical protein